MNHIKSINFSIILAILLLNGCAISPPFNNRMEYLELKKMRGIDSSVKDINIIWEPSEFPTTIEIKGASGFVGGGTQTRIPTGIAISTRLIEALDESLTVDKNSLNTLKIKIIKAESNFEYSAGFFNIEPVIDWGEVIFKGEFTFKNHTWKETFHFVVDDERAGGSSKTKPLEDAWDETTIAIAKSIINHINSISSK